MNEGVAYNNWMECEAEIKRLAIALRIKTEEHQCCAEDLISLKESEYAWIPRPCILRGWN